MNKKFKLLLKILGIILALSFIGFFIYRYTTKAHSPEDRIEFTTEDVKIDVFYNRPYKKDREIFGKLVPYDTVWRTGANEATTFSTNKDLLIDGSELQAGTYTLWTIPMEKSWKVIFNNKMYPWGINMEKEAYRDPQFDALMLEIPVEKLETSIEQFSIFFKNRNNFIIMVLAWDKTSISVPIKIAEAP